MTVMDHIIAVDGPAGSGKSTVSRILASRLGCLYLDTGAIYRAVALAAKRKGLGPGDPFRLGQLCRSIEIHFNTGEDPPRLFLGTEDVSSAIREPEMDLLSSEISSVGEVREAMTELQRRIAAQAERLVAEGRDMGTVVFPDARYKFFLTASAEERAERRYLERLRRGEKVSRSSVTDDLRKRDNQDETRSIAPLKPAGDAVIIDSTGLSADEVAEKMLSLMKE